MSRQDIVSGVGPVDAKRVFDCLVSAVALLLLFPALVLIAVTVRLDSKGPAVFRQHRVGRDGQIFVIHKFRSLRDVSGGALISPAGDPRVTRIGALLRKSKMDELPQLFDVLIGRMSLVGPRPEVPEYVALWPEADRKLILSVRPGITDPASIMWRNESQELKAARDPEEHYISWLLPRKVEMYSQYVRSHTFSGDLWIIARTVLTVLLDREPATSAAK